tara:strand:- start:306 stop:1886 length:1581 start_codon:yes stop_codon:yes gene_type:complete
LKYFFILFNVLIFISAQNWSQESSKIITIIQSGSLEKNEVIYPDANILLKKNNIRVHLFHEGADIRSDKSIFYSKNNFFNAEGNVIFNQGDTLILTSDYFEYDGIKKKAIAKGNVLLKMPDMTLETDTLFLDRIKNIAFYKTPGKIIDNSNILISNEGTYYIDKKKYNFNKNVRINNPEYVLTSTSLDYFTITKESFFYGPSKIIGKDYDIYCERGYYDSNKQTGNFKQNAIIYYNQRIIEGDSLYFENEKKYASASNKIIITDTINNSIIKGNFGEIFKNKDSAIITKKALAINIIDNDSLYIHADTLIATGPADKRFLRGYYNVKILKTDIKGKSDSLYLNESTGKMELLMKPFSKKDLQVLSSEKKTAKNPVLWFEKSQMSGEIIHLITDLESKKLDSLYIFGNSFIIEKDSLSENGYNQIKGINLLGDFEKGNLKNILVDKNTEVIYYMYSDEGELVGINKTICSSIKMDFNNNEIEKISFYISPDGKLKPEKLVDENLRELDGFIWRINEKPNTINDLFKK